MAQLHALVAGDEDPMSYAEPHLHDRPHNVDSCGRHSPPLPQARQDDGSTAGRKKRKHSQTAKRLIEGLLSQQDALVQLSSRQHDLLQKADQTYRVIHQACSSMDAQEQQQQQRQLGATGASAAATGATAPLAASPTSTSPRSLSCTPAASSGGGSGDWSSYCLAPAAPPAAGHQAPPATAPAVSSASDVWELRPQRQAYSHGVVDLLQNNGGMNVGSVCVTTTQLHPPAAATCLQAVTPLSRRDAPGIGPSCPSHGAADTFWLPPTRQERGSTALAAVAAVTAADNGMYSVGASTTTDDHDAAPAGNRTVYAPGATAARRPSAIVVASGRIDAQMAAAAADAPPGMASAPPDTAAAAAAPAVATVATACCAGSAGSYVMCRAAAVAGRASVAAVSRPAFTAARTATGSSCQWAGAAAGLHNASDCSHTPAAAPDAIAGAAGGCCAHSTCGHPSSTAGDPSTAHGPELVAQAVTPRLAPSAGAREDPQGSLQLARLLVEGFVMQRSILNDAGARLHQLRDQAERTHHLICQARAQVKLGSASNDGPAGAASRPAAAAAATATSVAAAPARASRHSSAAQLATLRRTATAPSPHREHYTSPAGRRYSRSLLRPRDLQRPGGLADIPAGGPGHQFGAAASAGGALQATLSTDLATPQPKCSAGTANVGTRPRLQLGGKTSAPCPMSMLVCVDVDDPGFVAALAGIMDEMQDFALPSHESSIAEPRHGGGSSRAADDADGTTWRFCECINGVCLP